MGSQDSSESRGSEPHGLTAMNGWWAASGLFILLVVFGVVAVIIWGAGGQTQAAAPALPAPSNSAPPAGGGSSGDQMIPTTAPPGGTWDLYRGVALPISAVDGPTSRAKGIWSGYAQTPTGALLAASYLAYATTGPDLVAVLSQHTIPSPAQAAAFAEAKATPPSAFNPADTAAISGFRFVSYSREAATIQIAGSGGAINMYSSVALLWVDGDWKLDLSAGFPIPAEGVSSLTGFIPWGAANG